MRDGQYFAPAPARRSEQVSKRKRFEVLKRDNFTCQYCGASAPNVELQVDHIHPVAKGGRSRYANLITACRHCNIGKSDIPLSSRPEPLDAYIPRANMLSRFSSLSLPEAVSDQRQLGACAHAVVQNIVRRIRAADERAR